MCYSTFQEYFEDVSKVIPAAVQNEKIIKPSSPPGWMDSNTLERSSEMNNQNNTRAAALLKKLVIPPSTLGDSSVLVIPPINFPCNRSERPVIISANLTLRPG